MNKIYRQEWIFCIFLALLCPGVAAEVQTGQRVAILDFELNDMTQLPRVPEELRRVASLAPLFRVTMARNGYEMIVIDAHAQALANAGFGYLYDQPAAAAELGARYGADWVVVGRLEKPSYLFAYLVARLVNVRSKALVANFATRIEGPNTMDRLTNRGVERLENNVRRRITELSRLLR